MSLTRSTSNDNANEQKFQLDKQGDACLYATVSQFRGDVHIHIKKYFKENPTKFGFCFKPEEWWRFVKHLQTTGVTRSSNFDYLTINPIRHGAVAFHLLKTEKSLYVTNDRYDGLLSKYVHKKPNNQICSIRYFTDFKYNYP